MLDHPPHGFVQAEHGFLTKSILTLELKFKPENDRIACQVGPNRLMLGAILRIASIIFDPTILLTFRVSDPFVSPRTERLNSQSSSK